MKEDEMNDNEKASEEKSKVLKEKISKISNVFDFEVESLDPDKRSWYYDDLGYKRKKDSS
jgi:hypothetical protein